MKSTIKSCETCNHCKKVYRLGGLTYSPFTKYYCDHNDEILTEYTACEHWQHTVKTFDFSPERFDQAEDDIKALLKIFENSEY